MTYDYSGTIVLNQYLWDRLQRELGWQRIGNYTPIFPSSQVPEVSSQSQPYIVYTFGVYDSNMEGINEEQVTYTIYGAQEAPVRKAVIFLSEILKQYDTSADDVNAWSQYNTALDVLDIFDFKYIRLISAIGPRPPETEGGAMDGLIVARMQYTRSAAVVDSMRSDDPYDISYRKILSQP